MKILTMIFRPSLLLITFAGCAFAQTVVLKADDNTGHDEVWEKRYTDGKNSWGIRGDRENATVYEGRIWFDKFPGVSGKYKVSDTNGICGWYQNQEKQRMIRYYALFCEVTKPHGKAKTNHPCQSISVCPLRVKPTTQLSLMTRCFIETF